MRIKSIIAVMSVAAIALTGCSSPNSSISPGNSDDPIVLGWAGALSGPLQNYGIAYLHGAEQAVADLNEAGGINGHPVELVSRDSEGDPQKAITAVQQLVNQHDIDVFVSGLTSGEGLAVSPIVEQLGVPQVISFFADEATNVDDYPHTFRTVVTNNMNSEAAVSYIVDDLNVTAAGVIADNTGFGETATAATRAELERRGLDLVAAESAEPAATDVTNQMSRLRSAGAEVVIVWTPSVGLIARILNARATLNWDVPIVGHPVLGSSAVADLLDSPSAWENAFSLMYRAATYTDDGPVSQEIVELRDKLVANYGRVFDLWWEASNYDAVMIAALGIEKAEGELTADSFRAVLESSGTIEGILGEYSYGADDHNGLTPDVLVVALANSYDNGLFRAADGQ